MRTKNYHILFLLLLTVSFSCTDEIDEEKPAGEWTAENEWIYETMEADYLWYNEIAKSTLDPSTDAETFFYSMLSRKDGKSGYYYSYIEEKDGTRAYMGDGLTYGFEYQAWRITDLNRVGLQILYVLPGSAAEQKGLKRGDWIFTLNGSNIGDDYYTLISSSSTLKVGVCENLKSYRELTEKDLTATRLEDNPVFESKVIPNTQVGYMAYHHFTTGPNGSNDRSYDIYMAEELAKLKQKGIKDFVLDLRYNPGGYVTSAQVLSSCLMPENKLDNIFCKMTYNDKRTKENVDLKFTKYISNRVYHPGLELNRIFVITSSRSASASELVIASLIPYFENNLYIIGDTDNNTEGKNVGSIEYSEDKYDWILHPIVCHVTNREEWDYSAGIPPTEGFEYSYSEEAGDEQLYPLGDENDGALKLILDYIAGRKVSAVKTKTNTVSATPLNTSFENRRIKGMILD
ncbi:MAG: S41 family peptidase [Tannerellaceae bacterium]|nr:S41 family peptidase [Tannerellaceae bacterium]